MAHGQMYDNEDYYDEEDPAVKAGEQNLGMMDGTDEDESGFYSLENSPDVFKINKTNKAPFESGRNS